MYLCTKYKILAVLTSFVLFTGVSRANCDVQAVLESIGRHTAIKALGWDPYYTVYTDERHVENSTECTIYCHGIGQNQTVVPLLQERELLLGTVIGFDFEDAVYDSSKLDYTKTSFGQEHETQALLYLLKHLDDAGMERLHLYGYSRGGAVVLNAIKQLICFVEHKKLFRRLKISHNQANIILEKIKAGTIVLDCPLLDMQAVTKRKYPSMHGLMDGILWASTLFKYAPWGDQGIKSASYCKHLDLALLVHFQENDRIVTNQHDDRFYEIIKGPRTHRTHKVIGIEGGHFHTGEVLAPEIQMFREKHGGSYIWHLPTGCIDLFSDRKRLTNTLS